MKRILAGVVLAWCVVQFVVLAMPTTARAYDVEECCQHASGLHQRVCCEIADFIRWWE